LTVVISGHSALIDFSTPSLKVSPEEGQDWHEPTRRTSTVSGIFTATSSTSPPCSFNEGRTSSRARRTRLSSGSLTKP